MRATQCFTQGFRRVTQTPSLVVWLYISLILLALPLTVAMRDILSDSIGGSLVERNLRAGFDLDWYGEFAAKHAGLARSFGPGVVGVLPILDNVERLVDGQFFRVDGSVLGAGVLFLLVWAFFEGGIIRRYSQPEAAFTRSVFFGDSARYFCRFVRLLVLSVAIYWGGAQWLAGKLFRWMEEATRDVTVEKTVIYYTVLIYAAILAILFIAGIALDYAKIALVTEDRRSAILALVRGLRFALSNPAKCLGLYLGLLLVGCLWLAAYGAIAPGPGQSRMLTVIVAFVSGQLFLIGRLILKLWFLSGQTLLYESSTRTPG